MQSKITIIAGPTASGKTGRSLTLAKQLGAAIISADSRMVYQGLDIGTGKPTWEYRQFDRSPWINPRLVPTSEVTILRRAQDSSEVKKAVHNLDPVYKIQGIDHYLLDVVQPEISFTLTDWLERARRVLGGLERQGKPVVVIGGTGLYLKALLQGFQPPPTDPLVRESLEKLATAEVFKKLLAVDPLTAQREKNNRRRLVRALEIFELTGQPASMQHKNTPLSAEIIKITLPRTELFARIDQRINDRLESGMIEEVIGLLVAGVSAAWLKSLGLEYRIITNWLLEQQNFQLTHSNLPSWKGQVEVDKKDKGELVARLQKEIHAYARRQETYLRTQLI
ncbi:MAG: tRNA (adenosine(37)-N6)-dimethylallyltransferase MiaA [Patescibacteria group bacterium]